MQFRWDEPGDDETLQLKATLFYYDEAVLEITPELQASSSLTARSYKIIPRREWGADESLRVWNPDEERRRR